MIETTDPKNTNKKFERCSECDRVVDHYNTFLSPTNEERIICWECLEREEKGFNASRDYQRRARSGVIPR